MNKLINEWKTRERLAGLMERYNDMVDMQDYDQMHSENYKHEKMLLGKINQLAKRFECLNYEIEKMTDVNYFHPNIIRWIRTKTWTWAKFFAMMDKEDNGKSGLYGVTETVPLKYIAKDHWVKIGGCKTCAYYINKDCFYPLRDCGCPVPTLQCDLWVKTLTKQELLAIFNSPNKDLYESNTPLECLYCKHCTCSNQEDYDKFCADCEFAIEGDEFPSNFKQRQ